MRIEKIKIYSLYTSVVAIAFLITTLIAFDKNVRDGYQFLWILPLSFMLVSIFSTNVMKGLTENLPVAIIWGGYFIRFVLTPLFLTFGNYRILFHTLTTNNIEKAILLMAYEVFIVFLILEIYLRNNSLKAKKKEKINLFLEKNKTLHFGLIVFSLVCVAIIIYIPQLWESFTTVFSDKSDLANLDYNIDNIAFRGTIDRALSSLFIFTFDIIRYLIPVYFLEIVYRRVKNSRLGYFLTLIVCVSPFMIISGSNVQPFIGLIINVVMMSKLYPNKSRRMKKVFVLLGAVLLTSILASKLIILGNSNGISGVDSLALTINAYFPGIGNTAASFNIVDINKLRTLFYDLFSTIPFRYSIFPNIASKEITLTMLFNNHNYLKGNIIPCISGAEHYLGFLFAPLIPAFLACFSVKMKIKAETSTNYWVYFYYMFFSIRVAMIPNLYNHISFIIILINQFIPIYLITIFIKRIRLGNKGEYMKLKS